MTENRIGSWMETVSGVQFYALDPRPENFNIADIAHSLSNQCRFAGHTKRFYSVAQHCVLVAKYLPQELKLWGLLHDASEAYLVDLPRPIKHGTLLGDEYRKIESVVQTMIYERYGLIGDEPLEVKQADNRMLPTERRDLMPQTGRVWSVDLPPYPDRITPWTPEVAKNRFLCDFYELTQ